MPNEVIQPKGLTNEEVQVATVFKIHEQRMFEKLFESFERDGHICSLSSGNWSDFSAGVAMKLQLEVKLKLNDRGRMEHSNHIVTVTVGEVSPDAPIKTETFNIEPAPPNQVRVETGQEVPVKTVIDGKVVEKRVKYAPRKKSK